MDFQKAKGHMADSYVYILTEHNYEDMEILAVFATQEAAEIAMYHYMNRINKQRGFWYEIIPKEILETSISESKGAEAPTVGEGLDPDHLVGPAT